MVMRGTTLLRNSKSQRVPYVMSVLGSAGITRSILLIECLQTFLSHNTFVAFNDPSHLPELCHILNMPTYILPPALAPIPGASPQGKRKLQNRCKMPTASSSSSWPCCTVGPTGCQGQSEWGVSRTSVSEAFSLCCTDVPCHLYSASQELLVKKSTASIMSAPRVWWPTCCLSAAFCRNPNTVLSLVNP